MSDERTLHAVGKDDELDDDEAKAAAEEGDELDEEDEEDAEEDDTSDVEVSGEVGSEGGSSGDVEIERIESDRPRGSEAGETWQPSEPSSQQRPVSRDETGIGRRNP